MNSKIQRYRSGSEPLVRSVFTRELCAFFDQMALPADNWPGIKNEDLIAGIVDAVTHVAKSIPNGMGLGMLHSLAFASLDAADRAIFDSPLKPEVRHNKLTRDSGNSTPPTETLSHFAATTSAEFSDEHIDSNFPDNLAHESPLFALGYSVAEGKLTERQRREILKLAIEGAKLQIRGGAKGVKNWGARNTTERLLAVVGHLYWLAQLHGPEKPAAKARWLSDLAWLREAYTKLGKDIDWTEYSSDRLESTRRLPNPAFMKPLTPSLALAAIVGSNPLPRTEVTKRVWDYIKINKLQDSTNKRTINADKKLRKIFGKNQASMFEMTRLINDHLG